MPKIPKFKNVQEEIKFWETHSLLDYLDETTEVHAKITDLCNKKRRTTIYLDEIEHENVRKLSFIKKISMNEFIRQAIKDKIRDLTTYSNKRRKVS